jgi:histidine triad (HIT) family protein
MADDCLFCRIARGELPSAVVREDDATFAFRDLNPQAPVHVLIVPRRHIGSVNDVTDTDRDVMGALFIAAREIARDEGLAADGYRVVMNTGPAAGQTVQHVHLHLLGGRGLKWPPG